MKVNFDLFQRAAVGLALSGVVACGQPSADLANSGSEPLVTQGPFLSASSVRTHVRNAGFPESLVETMVNIAHCESTFGAGSYAWAGGRQHTGLFQISDLHIDSCGYTSSSYEGFRASMTDPAQNARCAYVVYRNAGYSLVPWDCYTGRR